MLLMKGHLVFIYQKIIKANFHSLLEKENAENVNIDNVYIYEEFPGKSTHIHL